MGEKKIKFIAINLLVWVLYITLNYYLAYFQGLSDVFLIDYITKYSLVVPVFYLNAFVLFPSLFQKRRYFLFVVAELVLAVTHFYAFTFCYGTILPKYFQYPQWEFPIAKFFPRTFWWYFNYSLYGFGFWYAKEAIARQKQIRLLEKQNFVAETNFLKSQINPHFLHNTLNMLYSQAIQYSQGLGDNIMRLSNMMRYSLESIEREDGKVLLKDELQYMNDLIKIHQVRFSDQLCISYSQTGKLNGQLVPALSLITPVENCMKYADLRDKDNPLVIKVDVLTDGVHFFCRNKKKQEVTEESHGTGIGNLKKRLDFLYQDKYQLQTTNDKDYYEFELTIHNRV
jgi:two-component system LytT family sensor kinase